MPIMQVNLLGELRTDYVENPIQAARHASAVLAADKGIPSHIESHNGRDYAVVTDEGKRFLFCQK